MRYSIKAFIKEKNETVSNVASKLQLSRPTFDTYIAAYESGLKLLKEDIKKYLTVCFLIITYHQMYLKKDWNCIMNC